MNLNTHLIITSINKANKALRAYTEGCISSGTIYTVVGDRKSPQDFNLEGCTFLSIEDQYKLAISLNRKLPENHYARKNIGYIKAIKDGAQVIIETDDDNLPYESFWEERKLVFNVRTAQNKGWLNIYSYFSDSNIWPRGFHLDELNKGMSELESMEYSEVQCPIQQGLANDNPDVDAIYRLILPLPIKFEDREGIALGTNSICPFNSQNTTWFKQAFPLMYLPSYCSFRMTDIWRSFIAQRIAWEYNWHILFHKPTVYQERNEHSLMKDFEDEVPGYLNNNIIMNELLNVNLSDNIDDIGRNLFTCYQRLVEKNIFPEKELELVELWNSDLK